MSSGTGRRVAWILLTVVVIGAVAYALWPRGGHESVDTRARRLASELRCVDCEGLSVQQSATASARAARADIRARIRAGESDAEIRQAFVDRYGESVLLKPPNDGIGILVWALPVVVLLVGGAGLALALARWRREPTLTATDADEALVAEARESEVDA